jgi:hypothetical protein
LCLNIIILSFFKFFFAKATGCLFGCLFLRFTPKRGKNACLQRPKYQDNKITKEMFEIATTFLKELLDTLLFNRQKLKKTSKANKIK